MWSCCLSRCPRARGGVAYRQLSWWERHVPASNFLWYAAYPRKIAHETERRTMPYILYVQIGTTSPFIFSNQEIGCILRRHPHTKLKLIHALNGTKACSIGSWQLQAVQSTSVGLDTPYIHPKTDWLAPENWGLENYKYWIYGMESFKMLGHFWRPLYMIILIILIHLEYGTPCRPAFQNE